ncbi:MAG: hypothetical protein HOP33_16055 [Verrucomicrobia bacterium]|nr:hypothetical protein [Verrucomicrobiota bacterium]
MNRGIRTFVLPSNFQRKEMLPPCRWSDMQYHHALAHLRDKEIQSGFRLRHNL